MNSASFPSKGSYRSYAHFALAAALWLCGCDNPAPVLAAHNAQVFAQRWFHALGTAKSADDLRSYYAPEVDYYRKGLVSRAYIEADKNRYFERWPERESRLRGDIILDAGRDRAVANLPFVYRISNGTETKTGDFTVAITIQLRDGRPVIVREQEAGARRGAL